jgi:hypothetical protein
LVNRACTVLLGSLLIASSALGARAAAATTVAPGGYSPGSPASSEYREQLATAREIGARSGGQLAVTSLFGTGVTPGEDVRERGAGATDSDAEAPGRDGSDGEATALAADVREHSAIAAAARAPLDGPPSSLITGLLVVAALLATGVLVRLLRPRGAER